MKANFTMQVYGIRMRPSGSSEARKLVGRNCNWSFSQVSHREIENSEACEGL